MIGGYYLGGDFIGYWLRMLANNVVMRCLLEMQSVGQFCCLWVISDSRAIKYRIKLCVN